MAAKFRFPVPRHTVAKYLRDKRGNPIGLVAAARVSVISPDGNSNFEEVSVGWTLLRKGDKFNRSTAWATALGRASRGTRSKLPHALRPIVKEIRERAARYFKIGESAVLGADESDA
jgi:hypothetical protein